MGAAQTPRMSTRRTARPPRRGLVRGFMAAGIIIATLVPTTTSWANPLMGC